MRKNTLIKFAVAFAVITMVGTAFAWDGEGRRGYSMMNSGHHGQVCSMNWSTMTDDQRSNFNTNHHQFNNGWMQHNDRRNGHTAWNNDVQNRETNDDLKGK